MIRVGMAEYIAAGNGRSHMAQSALAQPGHSWWLAIVASILALVAPAAPADAPLEPSDSRSTDHPLEPPDRSSPRATLTTFIGSIDRAWELYSQGDPAFREPFRVARESLDVSDIPPLLVEEASAEVALLLKDIMDRIALPPPDTIPDRAMVEELGLTRWTLPHTEIQLKQLTDGDREGQWIFSARTVRFAEDYYYRVRHLPYRPGLTGGRIEELRSGSRSRLVMKIVNALPRPFKQEIAGMLAWRWCALGLMLVLMLLGLFAVGRLARRWQRSAVPGHRLADFLVPLTLVSIPLAGRYLLNVLITLPGMPTFVVRLGFSMLGYLGLAWLVALLVTRIGDVATTLWFRDARPLKKQFIKMLSRIATIVLVTTIALTGARNLGVPIAGLIAGLGVGGLAIALASQSTLENFIGGVILYADQPVRIGDFCSFGGQAGTVENVGLRSVKVRTLGRSLITIPNADFARLQLENLSERDRILLREELCVAYETTQAQLERLLEGLRTMAAEHPRIADDPLRVRFTGFGNHFLKIELFIYALTSDWAEFVEIREDVLLRVMGVVEGSGTRMALPTEIHYVQPQNGQLHV
jgi:MscS family membrane protein